MSRRALLLACALALPLLAGDPPDAAAVHALVAQMGSEDVSARDRAVEALVAMGEPVADLIRAELKTEAGRDAEVSARGVACLDRIATNAVLKKLWERDPQKDLDAWIAKRPCGTCGEKEPWKVWPIKHDTLREALPKARVYVVDWNCCQDRPLPSVILAVCRDPDALVQIASHDDLQRLTSSLMPIRTLQDFEKAASALMGLRDELPWDGPMEYEPRPIVAKKSESGHFVTFEPNTQLVATYDPETAAFTIAVKRLR